jgi:hypothetical protein
MLRRWWWVVPAVLLAWPATAHAARPDSLARFFSAGFDPAKPMRLGVQVAPVWGDHGDYTGRCRFGMPLGTMQASIRTMNRQVAVGRARENGLSESFGDKLSTEITNIAGLPTLAARKRIKRDAKKGRRSWGARASVLCALGGAMAAGPPLLYDLIVHHHAGADDVAQNGAIGCATGVTAPPLYKWAKAKGFTLEDE